MNAQLGERLRAVEEELRRWREDGQNAVPVQESTMELIRQVVGPAPLPEPKQLDHEIKISPRPKVKEAKQPSKPTLPEPPMFELPEGDRQSQWEWLRDRVLNCPTCQANLNPQGKVVFGVGDCNADLLFCGEAPGADEEAKGEPFVGKAGQLLDKIIAAMGLAREQTYIANVMNWRPQHENAYGNRPPTQEEMNFCLPYLKAQIAVVQPKVIVALGGTAVNGLLGHDPKRRMGEIRGNWQEFEEVPLMITFHPSYVLRNGSNRTKRMVWEDMLQIMEKLEIPISEKQRGFYT
jgi:uracil-DNA glycosylase